MSNYNLKEIYLHYKENGGTLEYDIYRNVCSSFNIEAMERVIYHGEKLDMGASLSRLFVKRVERNYKYPRVNWYESNKYKDQLIAEGKEPYSRDNPDGVKWFIYYTDEWYCLFYWEKKYCVVQNKSAYRLDMTRGLKGNKEKLKNHLRDNDLAYLDYPLDTND